MESVCICHRDDLLATLRHDDLLEIVRRTILRRLTTVKRRLAGPQAWGNPSEELTPLEREVLALLDVGSTTRGIADRLGLSPRAALTHRLRTARKLDLSNVPRTDASSRNRWEPAEVPGEESYVHMVERLRARVMGEPVEAATREIGARESMLREILASVGRTESPNVLTRRAGESRSRRTGTGRPEVSRNVVDHFAAEILRNPRRAASAPRRRTPTVPIPILAA